MTPESDDVASNRPSRNAAAAGTTRRTPSITLDLDNATYLVISDALRDLLARTQETLDEETEHETPREDWVVGQQARMEIARTLLDRVDEAVEKKPAKGPGDS